MFLLLWGCASRPVVEPFKDADFELSGKLGIRWADDRFSARFKWQQLGGAYRVELWGPLGQGRHILSGDGDHIEIRDAAGALIEGGPVEAVMLRRLGWAAPLDALPSWMHGRPVAGHEVGQVEQDEQGRVLGFEQLGWQLRFERFEGEQPRRVTAERGDYRVRVVL